MTTKYFNVKGGLTTGNITIDGSNGNITMGGGGSANLGNLVVANYFQGNGSLLSALTGANVTGQVGNALIAGTVYTNAQPNITSVGTLTSLSVSANITSGNISGGNLVSANYFSGNGSLLTSITGANVTGTVANATYAVSAGTAGSATTAGTVTTGAQPNITSTGRLTTLVIGNSTANVTITDSNGNGFLTATGNITAPYFIGNVYGNISGNLTVPGNNTDVIFNDSGAAGASDGFKFNKSSNVVTINGNITLTNATSTISGANLVSANYHSGDGGLLSNITAANIVGTVANANYSLYAGTVLTNAQPNITSVGTLASVSVTANANVGNLNTAGNINVTNTLNATGTGTGALIVAGGASITKDLYVGGNIYVPNLVSTTSQILEVSDPLVYLAASTPYPYSYEIGVYSHFQTSPGTPTVANGYQHTGVVRNHADNTWYMFSNAAEPSGGTVDLSNANLVLDSFKSGSHTISGFANISGNVTAANASLGNLVTSNYFSGNGSLLTSLTGGNVTGQVGNALIAGTVYTNAQPNITSVGTLSSLTVSGTTNLGAVGNVTITGGSSGQYLQTNGSGTLTWQTISTSSLSNGNSNVSVLSNANVTISSAGNANVVVVTGTGANVTGTFNVSGNVIAQSKMLVGLSTTSLVNPVAVFSGSGASYDQVAVINTTGTGSADITTYGNNGDDTQSWADMGFTGNSFSDANYTVTAAGDGYFFVQGNTSFGGNMVIATGNTGTTKDIIFATGGFQTANIKARLYNANGAFSVTGNINAGNVSGGNLVSANYFSGDGHLITNVSASSATTATSATTAGTVTTAAQPNITSVGTLVSLSVTGNVSAGNANLGNLVTANFFSGSGNLLSNIQGANVSGTVASATVAATVTTAAQPNITSVGTLTSVAVTGNATVGNVKINGGILSNRSNVSIPGTSTDTIIDQFPTTSFRSAKYYITGKGTNGYQSAEILLVQDGTNSYITIYGSICSNATADLLNFSSNIDGTSGNVRVYANTASTSTTVNLVPIYLND